MARKPKKPPLTGCKGSSHAPKHGGWLSWHWWHYSDHSGGWRCLDCGEFVRDQSDKEVARFYADAVGAPDRRFGE